jgi:hypothetical protein
LASAEDGLGHDSHQPELAGAAWFIQAFKFESVSGSSKL